MSIIQEAFSAYKTYLGIKNHFSVPSYDYAKYGEPNAKFDTFLIRNDRIFFEKLAKKYDAKELRNFYAANFMISDSLWVGDLLNQNAQEIYQDWKKRNESLEYVFKQDCNILCSLLEKNSKDFNFLFDCKASHPIIMKCVLRKEITSETYVIIDRVLNFSGNLNKSLSNDPFWNSFYHKHEKYKIFVDIYGKEKIYRKVLKESVKQMVTV